MPSIFELTKEQAELKALVTSGEISQEDAQDTFEAMNMEFDDKVKSYCVVIRTLELELENLTSEKNRLTTLESQKKNEIKRVKQTLITGLSNAERSNFDVGTFKGHIRKGVQSVKILNADNIPAEYIETKVEQVPDKTAIKAALKAGEKLDGAELVTGESSLIIK